MLPHLRRPCDEEKHTEQEQIPLYAKGDSYSAGGVENQEIYPVTVTAQRTNPDISALAAQNPTMGIVIDGVPVSPSTEPAGTGTAAATPQTPTEAAQPSAATPPASAEAAPEAAGPTTPSQSNTASAVAGAVSTASAEAKTVSTLAQQMLGKEADGMYKLANDRLGMAAMFDNGMVLFEEGRIPERHMDAYTYHLDEVKAMIEDIRQSGMEAYDKFGDFARKAYIAGALAKYAGHAGTAADVYELGSRAKTAIESNSDSAWDAVTGQVAKMAANVAGGSLAVLAARGLGLIVAAMGAPTAGVVAVTLVAGGGLIYAVGEAANYIDREISKGNNPFDFSSDDGSVTDVALVGDIDYSKYGTDTLIKADNLTLIGNQRFSNLETQSKSLNIVGDIHSEGRLIIDSDQTEVVKLEDIVQEAKNQPAEGQTEQTKAKEQAETPPAADTEQQEQAEAPPTADTEQQAQAETALPDTDGILEKTPEFDLDTALRMLDGGASPKDIEMTGHHTEQPDRQQVAYPDAVEKQEILSEVSTGALIQ